MALPSYANSPKDFAWFLIVVTVCTGLIAGLGVLRKVQGQVATTVAGVGGGLGA